MESDNNRGARGIGGATLIGLVLAGFFPKEQDRGS